jgi:hypothetical protein
MVLIKVQYDAYNRQFKLLDQELAHVLADGESYLLIADMSPRERLLTESELAPTRIEHVIASMALDHEQMEVL